MQGAEAPALGPGGPSHAEGLDHPPADGLVASGVATPFSAIQVESALLSPPVSLQPFCIHALLHLSFSTPSPSILPPSVFSCLLMPLCSSGFSLKAVAACAL